MSDNAKPNRATLRNRFLAGMKPTENDFTNLINSQLHQQDDHIQATSRDGFVDITIGQPGKDGLPADKLLVQAGSTFTAPATFTQTARLANASIDTDLTVGRNSQLKGDARVDGQLAVSGSSKLQSVEISETARLAANLSVAGKSQLQETQTTALRADSLQLGSSPQITAVIGNKLEDASLPDQQLATVAAIREYIAATSLGLTLRAEALLVATTPQRLSGIPPAIDGIVPADGDFVLLTRQEDREAHPDNRLWQVKHGAWVRAEETDGTPFYELERGTAILVKDGQQFGGKLWVMNGEAAKPSWQQRTDLDYLRAGNGLQKQGLNLSLKLAANPGLQNDSNGLALAAGNGIEINAAGAAVRPGKGLQIDGNAVAVKSGHGLDTTSGTLNLKLAANPGLQNDSNGLALAAGNGIEINASGAAVRPGKGLQIDGNAVAVKSGHGLDTTSGTLNLKLAANPGLQNDSNGLALAAGNGIEINASGAAVRPGKGLQIDGNAVAVKSGHGLDTTSGTLNLKLAANPGLQNDGTGLRARVSSPLELKDDAVTLDLTKLDEVYLSKRIVFVPEGTTAETKARVDEAFKKGAVLVGTYRS